MKIIENKYIVYDEDRKIKASWEHKQYTNKELSIPKLIWALLTEKGFKWKFQEALKYALIHADCYRGTNASDVMLFECTKNFDKIWEK